MTRCSSRRYSGKKDNGCFESMGSRMDDFIHNAKDEFARPHRGFTRRGRGFRPPRLAGLYRSRQGRIFGVCRGLAEYFDLSVGWVRFFTVVAFVITGIWPVGLLYLIAALVMKPAPVITPRNEEEAEFYESYAESRQRALERLSRSFDRLERRLQRVEDVVTSREFHWQSKSSN